MLYQVLVPASLVIIPVLVITTKCQQRNDSDVIVTYSNHAEADNGPVLHADNSPVLNADESSVLHAEKSPVLHADKSSVLHADKSPVLQADNTAVELKPTVEMTEIIRTERYKVRYEYEYSTERKPVTESSDVDEPIQDDVVFLPNDRELQRNEDYLQNEAMNFNQILGGYKSVGDVLGKKTVTTPATQEDTIFVAGKNNENEDKAEKETPSKKGTYVDLPYGEVETEKPKVVKKLDCKHLDCDNVINSVCGGKIESLQWKYRLFLNECYFRKVNCNFQNAANRYKHVSLDYCKNVGIHQQPARRLANPLEKYDLKPVQVDNSRRSTSARRSMTVSVDGQLCSHPCPVSCPEDYVPECAATSSGDYQVFLNHCKLDLNSCSRGVLWRRRPLAECVGGKKADLQQNRRFIDWMQRVGIVDKKGRLSLS